MDEFVKDFDLTGVQFSVIAQLGRFKRKGEENISQTMLENATHMTHATMTELLKKLEKKGFVTVRADERDRRRKCIEETEKCALLREKIGRCDEDIFSELCQGLSADDIDQLLRITDHMIKNARNITTEKGGESA